MFSPSFFFFFSSGAAKLFIENLFIQEDFFLEERIFESTNIKAEPQLYLSLACMHPTEPNKMGLI